MPTLISSLQFLGSVARWMASRPKDTILILLILCLAFAGFRLRRAQDQAAELQAKIEGLAPGIKQTITIHKDRIVTRTKDGPERIIYKDRYLPPEGHIDISTPEDAKPGDLPIVNITDWGFTRRIGGGLLYSKKGLPELDVKWFYWKRYSTVVGITPEFPFIGASRHVDDFTPFQNLELMGSAGIDWSGERRFGIGFRTNF